MTTFDDLLDPVEFRVRMRRGELLSRYQAAVKLGIHVSTVDRWRDDHLLRCAGDTRGHVGIFTDCLEQTAPDRAPTAADLQVALKQVELERNREVERRALAMNLAISRTQRLRLAHDQIEAENSYAAVYGVLKGMGWTQV